MSHLGHCSLLLFFSLTLKVPTLKIAEFANSLYSDKAALLDLDILTNFIEGVLRCLQSAK